MCTDDARVETNKLVQNPLFHILTKLNDKSQLLLRKSLNIYLTEEKLKILSHNDYRSERFKCYLSAKFLDTKQRGRYLVGLSTSKMDWLIDVFHEISQAKNFYKIYDMIKIIFIKIK